MNNLDEKSVSTAQQSLMGQAYGLKSGELEISDLDPRYRKKIKQISQRMTLKQLKDFAETKHKGLKHHVDDIKEEESQEMPTSLEAIPSDIMPIYTPHGPGKIVPFLNPDSKQAKKGKKNLQNLKDYRDWISQK